MLFSATSIGGLCCVKYCQNNQNFKHTIGHRLSVIGLLRIAFKGMYLHECTFLVMEIFRTNTNVDFNSCITLPSPEILESIELIPEIIEPGGSNRKTTQT